MVVLFANAEQNVTFCHLLQKWHFLKFLPLRCKNLTFPKGKIKKCLQNQNVLSATAIPATHTNTEDAEQITSVGRSPLSPVFAIPVRTRSWRKRLTTPSTEPAPLCLSMKSIDKERDGHGKYDSQLLSAQIPTERGNA